MIVNISFDLGYFFSHLSILKYVALLKPTVACFQVFFLPAKLQIMYPCITDHTDHPEMDKSKKEEAKLEAEETFWEGPPSSTEALQTRRDSDSIRSCWSCVVCFFVIFRCFPVLFAFLSESQSRRQCPALSSPKQLLQEANI